MQILRQSVYFPYWVAGILVAAAALMLSPRHAAADASKDVVVTPLPLSVTVSNSATGPLPVRDVDNPARTPFTFVSGEPLQVHAVPPGKRYVIQHYAATCNVDAVGIMSDLRLAIVRPGTIDVEDHAAPRMIDSNGGSVARPVLLWSASANTQLYADPGTSIQLLAVSNFRATGAVVRSCGTSVSGYVTDQL
jgi:hypothetical protein